MSTNDSMPVYLPEDLDVDMLIREHPPVEISKFDRDELTYVLSLPATIASRSKDLISDQGFVPINAQSAQSILRNYNQYLAYAVGAGVLETDHYYVPCEKSRGYRYAMQFDSPPTVRTITKPGIMKHRTMTVPGMDPETVIKYSHLSQWWTPDLTIDADAAYQYVHNDLLGDQENRQRALLRFHACHINIHRLENQQFYFKQDVTVYRLHTNMTFMASDLRNFMTFACTHLAEVDIGNCQPYLSTMLLNKVTYTDSGPYTLEGIDFYLPGDCVRDILHLLDKHGGMSPDMLRYIKLVAS